MAIFPVLVLLLGAIGMWAMRNRSARFGWSLATTAAALAWLGSLFIPRSLPIHTSLSVWRPVELFETQIELAVDDYGAKLVIAGASAIFAVVLSTAIKLNNKEFRLRALVLIFGGITLMAMLSANILTVALSWALIDIVKMLNALSRDKEKAATSNQINRLVLNVAGLFALIGVAIVRGISGENNDLAVPFGGFWATAILIVAVFLRVDLFSVGSSLEDKPDEEEAFDTLAGALPQAAAVVVLVRQLAFGIPEELIIWIRVACLIGLPISASRYVLEENIRERQRLFNLGMLFLGLLVSSAVPSRANATMASAVGAMILVGTLCRIIRIHSPWQRVLPVLGALILVMPGWTVGALLVQGIANALDFGPMLWIALISVLSLALIAAGTMKEMFNTSRVWYVDDLARLLYALALFLPVAIGIGLGSGTGSGIGVRSSIVSLISAGAAVGSLAVMRRMDKATVQGILGFAAGIRVASIFDAGRNGLTWITKSLRLLGGILEGEGAMLWVFVILMMIQLAIGG